MRNFLKFSLSAFALMFLLGTFAVTETKAQNTGPLGEALKRMDEHNKALTSLRASVVMEKYNSQLDESDITEGKVIYLPQKGRDAYVRIDWTKPVEESLAIVNKQYRLYRPALKQAMEGKVDSAKGSPKAGGALAFMNMSKKQLRDNYTMTYAGQENVGSIPTWHIVLVPKTKTSYKSADLWVDGNGMPIQAKVTENNNDTTKVLLSNLEKNKTIDASVFVINLPKGTKKITG
jgi:outer membrane lipoprotein-sorting protein